MLIGYARVSTEGQKLKAQVDELKAAGCEKIFKEKKSALKERPGFDKALDYARKGDTLVVWRLDRLARSLRQLINLVSELEERGIGLKSLHESIDTTTSSGKLIFHIFGALAEFEREVIRERTMIGLKAARARGRMGGRPRIVDPDKQELLKKLHSEGKMPVWKICKTLGISKSTYYKYLNLSGPKSTN